MFCWKRREDRAEWTATSRKLSKVRNIGMPGVDAGYRLLNKLSDTSENGVVTVARHALGAMYGVL